jgi:hypothetical protein
VNLVAPTITGVTLPGLVLKASRGVWANEPTSFTYQWQACNGFSCSAIPGVVGEAFPLTSAYVGDTIRVVVAAQNSGGGTTAASAFTGTIGSRVEASVEWGIEWFNAYTLIVSVEVVGVPHGATTEVTCHGKGCPFRSLRVTPGARQPKCRRHHHCRRHGAGLSVGARFAGHRLRPGTVVSVRVSKPGWEGRLFTMKVRSRHRPEYRKLCLAPGSSTTGTCI